MAKYFECIRGCTGCCPGGTYAPNLNFSSEENNVMPVVTIGDIYRSFLNMNPEQLSFSDFIGEHFRYAAACNFSDLDNPNDMEKYLIEKFQELGLEFFNAPEIGGFSVLPITKNPCVHINESGCGVYGTVIRYLVCNLQPEEMLLKKNKSRIDDNNIMLFPCIKGKDIDPKQQKRVQNLARIRDREIQIMHKDIFPYVTIKEWGGGNSATMDLKELCKNGLDNIVQIVDRNMKSFDDSSNRKWENEIKKLTDRYAEIIKEYL